MAAIALIPVAASFVYTPGASGASAFPSIGTNGISFSASVPTDPQRDVGEPEVHIDRAGNIYTCGPSGFSNVADYMQISTDGGDQFHLLGAPPRGQISGGEGGGDCGLATGTEPNAKGNYTLAYSGLGPLANFSTFTSDDMGQTIHASPVSESVPGVDRQWHVFTGPNTVLFNYNSNSSDYTVQKSTDGGLTYGQPISTGAGGGRIGPLRAILSPDKDPDKAVVYFPSYLGSTITVTRSLDGGATWATCVVTDSELNPSAGFVIADNDTAGNVYIVYSEKGGDHDTYMTVMPASAMAGCADSVELNAKQFRVNRDSVDTTVMPWVVAGAPGRIAVAFFGTDSDGDPDDGSFVASWYPYVSMSLNALSGNPTWAQTRATTHPFHYGSICLGGLSCDISVPKGDRSLADYFAMDLSTITGRLSIVYGSSAKKPDDAVGHVSTATVVVQETGPGLLGGTLSARRPVLRPSTTDAEGDALAPYSQLYPLTANRANLPAMDITSVAVGPEIDLDSGDPVDDPGVTITMKVKDLSNSALQSAAQGTGTPSQSLVYLFRFLNGFQPAGATAAWNPATGFSFGFDNFTTKSAESGQPDPTSEKIIVWPQATSIKGKVNQDAGIIQLSVPRSLLHIQSGSTGPDSVPELTDAIDGSRLFDGTAFTLGNTFTPLQADQSYLYPVDETASMDFLVGKATYPTTGGTTGGGSTGGNEGNKNTGGNNGGTTTPPPATLPTTGASSGFSLALLVLMSTAGVLIYVRRRSAA